MMVMDVPGKKRTARRKRKMDGQHQMTLERTDYQAKWRKTGLFGDDSSGGSTP